MPTNATDPILAQALASIDRMLPVCLTIKKKGTARGPVARRRIFGDDKVQVLLLAGFSYKDLVARSEKKLQKMGESGTMYHDLIEEARQQGNFDVTLKDACEAVQEVRDWLIRAQGEGDPNSPPPEGLAFEPLVRDGHVVPGCKVYVGAPHPEDDRAPVPGTVYLHGLKLTEKVLEPAPNGDWIAQSKGKTVAKNLLRKKLPVGRYVSYVLLPHEAIFDVGEAAVKAADAAGLEIPAGVADNLLRMSDPAAPAR